MSALGWTPLEDSQLMQLRREKVGVPTIARMLNKSRTSTFERVKALAALCEKPAVALDESANYWRDECVKAKKELAQAQRERTATDALVEAARDMAPVAYSPSPYVRTPRSSKHHKPQSAVLFLSDTHIGQVIEPEQTLGFGGYNFAIFQRRLKSLELSVLSILQEHTTTTVPELVLCLGGDMLHGALAHSAEAGHINPLFTQFYAAGHTLAQFVRNLAAAVPKVRVYTAVGNHPRWSDQKKMPTVNRFSNFDQVLYALVEALCREVKNVAFTLDKQPFALFDVQGFQFYLGHGDHLKGGDRILGIPNHAIGRQISSNTQLFNKAARQAPHYYLFGHFHRNITLPHALGEIIINGGFPGIDGFGLMGGFNPVDPLQKFFFMHAKSGRTACYDLGLKFADEAGPLPYPVPEQFLPA
jgi:hypothetical protein